MIDKELAIYACQSRKEAAQRLENRRLEEHAAVLLENLRLGLTSPEEAIDELEQVYG